MSEGRILFVDHAAVLGGAELSLLDIAIALRERSNVVLFEHGPFEERLRANGVAVRILGGSGALRSIKKSSTIPSARSVLAVSNLARDLARTAREHEVLYANSPKSFLVSAAAAVIARRPVIWHLRDIIDPTHFSAANIRLMVLAANTRAARVIANSRATADAFVAAGGKPQLVTVVYNGIDPRPFEEATPVSRATLGIDEDAFVVGSFSRLHPWKGLRVLFDALEELPNVQALIVGGALFSGEAEFEMELRSRANTDPLRGRVHLVGARDDVPALMATCDVIVHAAIAPEPFGRVIVEALLARRPLIAANAGGVREIVENGTMAILTPPGDVAALRDAIELLSSHPGRAALMMEAGARHVRASFSRDAMIAGVTRVIEDVLA